MPYVAEIQSGVETNGLFSSSGSHWDSTPQFRLNAALQRLRRVLNPVGESLGSPFSDGRFDFAAFLLQPIQFSERWIHYQLSTKRSTITHNFEEFIPPLFPESIDKNLSKKVFGD